MLVMNQKIQFHIKDISDKTKKLINRMSELKNENGKLKTANNELALKLAESEQNLKDVKTESVKLDHLLQSSKQGVIDSSSVKLKENNKEIDQLVREIENCIDQLKR
jgi:chromosome segregation ATPase